MAAHDYGFLWEAIAAVVAGGLGWLANILKSKKKHPSIDAILGSADIVDSLNKLAEELNCDRGLLLYTSNGGGVPTAGKPLYVTILYEVVHTNNLEPIRGMFQGTPIDNGYLNLLKRILLEGSWSGSSEDLEKGFLKDLYFIEDVKHATIYPVEINKTRFYYLSVRWYQDEDIPSEELIRFHCTNTAQKISKILRSQPK